MGLVFSPLIKYFANALSHRGGADNEDALDGIDDTWNGLLLWSAIHHPVETGALAFLKTPNFCLSVDVIPCARREENQASPTNRLTLHYIAESGLGVLLPSIVPNNIKFSDGWSYGLVDEIGEAGQKKSAKNFCFGPCSKRWRPSLPAKGNVSQDVLRTFFFMGHAGRPGRPEAANRRRAKARRRYR
ncbi:hypothetical protein F5887DRAFT_916759 [Amanita rubescens]|nr:hypothetical protein F5887DRAFT_916759 [Amanita rubescens]